MARSYGDLSENHEYKAAKEMQKLLMTRKADLERNWSAPAARISPRRAPTSPASAPCARHRSGHEPAGALRLFSGRGIRTRKKTWSATFPQSPSHCLATRLATRWSLKSTGFATIIGSTPSSLSRRRSAAGPRAGGRLQALPPKVTWSSTSSRSNHVAISSRLGAIFPWTPWKNSRDSVSAGARCSW